MSNTSLENFTTEELRNELQIRKKKRIDNEQHQRIIDSQALMKMLSDFPEAFPNSRDKILDSCSYDYGYSAEKYHYSIDCYYNDLEN